MAEDLHMKAYFISETDGTLQPFDVFSESDDNIIEATSFKFGRNYDLFCLFGSRRGQFKDAYADGYGLHASMKEDQKTFASVVNDKDSNNYSFRWFTIDGLQKMLTDYKHELNRPKKYFDKDSDEYKDIEDNVFDFDAWNSAVKNLVLAIDNLLDQIVKLKEVYELDKEFYNRYFILENIIIQTWLDS